MKVGRRLSQAISCVPDCRIAVDCGADHGKLTVELLLCGKAEHVYAVDISAPSLQKARLLAREYGVEEKCTFIVGNGLQKVPESCGCVIIAGMGGEEIISILQDAPIRHEKYVLLPHKNAVELRRFLYGNGYCINKDYVVKESEKYYHILSVSHGEAVEMPCNIYFGMQNDSENADFCDYLFYRKGKLEEILSKITTEAAKMPISEELSYIEEAINGINR